MLVPWLHLRVRSRSGLPVNSATSGGLFQVWPTCEVCYVWGIVLGLAHLRILLRLGACSRFGLPVNSGCIWGPFQVWDICEPWWDLEALLSHSLSYVLPMVCFL